MDSASMSAPTQLPTLTSSPVAQTIPAPTQSPTRASTPVTQTIPAPTQLPTRTSSPVTQTIPAPTQSPTRASTPVSQPTPLASQPPTRSSTMVPIQGSDKDALLKRTTQILANAFVNQEWVLIYGLLPEEFKANCSEMDFDAMMTLGWESPPGVPEGITAVIEEVRSDDNQAWVIIRFEKDGIDIGIGVDSLGNEPTFVWEDGKWLVYVSPEGMAGENPCDLDSSSKSNPKPTQPPMPAPTMPATPDPTPTPLPPEPINISGSGIRVDTITLLSEGVWIVDINVSGNEDCSLGTCSEDNFIVTIESADGSSFENPANEIVKDWSGEVTVAVGGLFGLTPGEQVVSVDASGDWTISFNLALPLAPPSDPDAPISIAGSGTAVETITLLSEGIWIVALEVSGNEDCSLGSCSEDNFIVTIESADGSSFENPANEIVKDWSGEVTVAVGGLFGLSAGTQVVGVDASGDWTITFTKV